jgi:hypothetical protein
MQNELKLRFRCRISFVGAKIKWKCKVPQAGFQIKGLGLRVCKGK